MNAKAKEDLIDTRYLILEKLENQKNAKIFLVKEKESNKSYVAKVFKEETSEIEIEILNILKTNNNPYTVKIIYSGEGEIIRKNKEPKKRKYFISEFCPYGNLFDYIYVKPSGLGELYSKIIFSKILKGIKICHELNICHRDIKSENILLDENYNPKIIGFNYATKNSINLKDGIDINNLEYKPPEISEEKEYDGKKADIFNLGILLMILVTGFQGFKLSSNYKILKEIEENKNNFWKLFNNNNIKLSEELKDLNMKMISYNPDKRPNIEEILNHPWFNEIKEMNIEQKDKIENEIKKEFNDLNQIIKNNYHKEFTAVDRVIEFPIYTTRTIHEEFCLFRNDTKVENINDPINWDNYIIIKGYINPNKFMNHLCEKLSKKFEDGCLIEASKNKLKFDIYFEEEETNADNDNEEGEEEIVELTMEIRLYKLSEGHLIKFWKKNGSRKNFLDKFNLIAGLVENIVS